MVCSARPHTLLSEELMIARRSKALRLERWSVPVSTDRTVLSCEDARCACCRIMFCGIAPPASSLGGPFHSNPFSHQSLQLDWVVLFKYGYSLFPGPLKKIALLGQTIERVNDR